MTDGDRCVRSENADEALILERLLTKYYTWPAIANICRAR